MKQMKIKSMTATFGKLNRAHLEPGPGLTLIHAPNEGGKSTWAAFWRAMLYGVDTRDRDRKGYLAGKNRFQPWSGAPMEGEIILEYEGRDITLRRGPRGNVPFGDFSAVYTQTQTPVPGLTAANCGELLTGAGQEVFSRSAFLGDGNLTLTSAPELERRIAALVSSGEEEVSFSQAMDRLKEWKNRRQVNRSVGEIPKLEGELERAREELERQSELCAQIALLEEEQTGLLRERDNLAGQIEAHRLLVQQELSARYAQAEEEYQAAKQQADNLERELTRRPIPNREELKQAQGEMQYIKVLEEKIRLGEPALKELEAAAAKAKEEARDERFSELSGEEAVAKAAEINASIQTDSEKRDRLKGRFPKLAAVFLLLAAILGAGTYFVTQSIPLSAGLAGGVCGAVLLSAALVHARLKKMERRISTFLDPFGVNEPDQLTALAQNYWELCKKAEEAESHAEAERNVLTDRQNRRDTAKTALLDFVHQFAPEVRDLFGCSAALSRALNLDHDLARVRELAQERRRRLEDLAAQGAGSELFHSAGKRPLPPVPQRNLEELTQALAGVEIRLEESSARLNQARGAQTAMGDPAALSARLEELENCLTRRREEFEAINLAMDALSQASTRLQERFSPELNRLTGEYLARLTGNKYPSVSLTRELDASVRCGGDILPRSALYLSRGTLDQLYLAARLAVCRLCLPARPPIMLDDALASFDDERLTLALELLWELSGKQQILLFTCQKREGEIISNAPGVSQIEL